MRERIKTIVLAAVCLALAGLLVWQLWPETEMVNPIQFDPVEIVSVDMVSYQCCGAGHDHPITVTSEADIRELCELWNNTWATRIFPEAVEEIAGGASVKLTLQMVNRGAVTYRTNDLYFYEWDDGDEADRVYYSFGPCDLNDALLDFIIARTESEVEP